MSGGYQSAKFKAVVLRTHSRGNARVTHARRSDRILLTAIRHVESTTVVQIAHRDGNALSVTCWPRRSSWQIGVGLSRTKELRMPRATTRSDVDHDRVPGECVAGWPPKILATRPTPAIRYTGDAANEASLDARARVSVVIPTLNEAANLPHVFARLPSCVDEVVLVDGHSSDDTIAVARALMPDVRVLLQSGQGKGNALACGFAASSGDVIVMLDADGSTDPAEIPQFVQPLMEGADFAKGSRFVAGGASTDMTTVRRIGNRLLTGLVNLLYGTGYTDLCYGYNAFWAHCLPCMQVDCSGFEVETLINTRIARAGLRVHEVASVEHERLHGDSHLRATRDGFRVLRTILAERGPSHLGASPQ